MLGALVLALQAAAPAPAADPGIVVTGQRLPTEELARELAEQVTERPPPEKPLARFQAPVCFGTVGLSPRLGAALADRMVAVAADAGAPLAGEGCQPNVLVLFVDSGKDAVTELRSLLNLNLGDPLVKDLRRAQEAPGPVRVVGTTQLRNRDGRFIADAGQRSGAGDFVVNEGTGVATRIGLPTRRDLLVNTVVIDRQAVEGKSIGQVADYAAMRSLAETRDSAQAGSSSILSLFAPGVADAPDGLTAFDRAYLRGLYASAADAIPASTISAIAREAVRAEEPDGR